MIFFFPPKAEDSDIHQTPSTQIKFSINFKDRGTWLHEQNKIQIKYPV